MRPLILIAFLSLLVACKKEKDKGPDCRFSMMASNGNNRTPVSYHYLDTMVTIEDGGGYNLYFNRQGRLLRKEYPLVDPYRRFEMVYNNQNLVSEMRYYSTYGGPSWVYDGKCSYTYDDKRRIIGVGQPSDREYYQVVWQGNDVQKVVYWFDQQVQCTVTFTYDGAIQNPNRKFSYFYFVDDNANNVNYKLPYYFSQHLLTKQETTCWVEQPKNFSYTFTPEGFISTVTIQQGAITYNVWEYEYECK